MGYGSQRDTCGFPKNEISMTWKFHLEEQKRFPYGSQIEAHCGRHTDFALKVGIFCPAFLIVFQIFTSIHHLRWRFFLHKAKNKRVGGLKDRREKPDA
jgi:hypothetical protein